jgi:hypothetical protein
MKSVFEADGSAPEAVLISASLVPQNRPARRKNRVRDFMIGRKPCDSIVSGP